MLGLGKIATVRDSATVSPARSQEIYQRYAVELYRQALLNLDDPASAGHVACDALVNECALAAMPERGEDDARYRLAESVFRHSQAGPGRRRTIAAPGREHSDSRYSAAWGTSGSAHAGDPSG